MKKRLAKIIILYLLLFSYHIIYAASPKADAQAIVKKMDELYRSKSSMATVEMEITTPHWTRTLKMKAWSSGMDKTFIRILEPKKEMGIATLRIGNEMWNFLPNTNKVIKIPPSMMMGSWMGSDFTNDDLVKEYTFINDYIFELTTVDNLQEGVVYVKCTPKEGVPVVWGYIIVAVLDKDYTPLWEKFYDEKEQLMREINFRDPKTFGKRTIPTVMELIPSHKPGNKTTIRYLDIQFDIKLAEQIFSLRNLRSE